ncbi:MAG: DMT family transporter [Clostridium sp.]
MNAQKLFSKKWIVFATAVLCTLLWGSAFPGIKTGYRMFRIASQDTADQFMFAGARFLIAGILTLLISFFVEKKEHKKERRKQWPKGQIVLVAFVQTALQYVFYYIGMAHVTGVKGAILNGSTAFFCVVTACIFYHESINGRKIAGCLLGLLGVFVVNLGKGSIGGSFSFLGEGFMLCSAVSSALGSLCNKEAAKKMGPVTLCGWQLILGAVLLIGVGFLFGGRISILEVPVTGWLLLLYLAFLSAAAFSLWTVLLKYNPMGRVTVFNFLIPVFGSLLSVIFLKDSLWNVNTLFALLLVCAGIYLVNREPKNISK